MPVVGLGSWITFNVGQDPVLLDECANVVSAFFAGGGRMIDSSPMYGSSQATIGFALKKLGYPENAFSADKIWTSCGPSGAAQFVQTRGLWGVRQMDLMQVHNLLSWRAHFETLQDFKASRKIRYIGITTSHGRRHGELEAIMSNHEIDFVQFTYNILDREPEARLLPLAIERGISVIVNRPYRRGALIRRFSGRPLPAFAREIDTGRPGFPALHGRSSGYAVGGPGQLRSGRSVPRRVPGRRSAASPFAPSADGHAQDRGLSPGPCRLLPR
jgi:diketogulonate reductase-like aldo/keto reductase